MAKETTPAKQRRQHFIELIAYWEGRVNTAYLTTQFGISRQQASADINDYIEHQPRNLTYNASRRAYVAAEAFTYNYISGDAAEYLEWVYTGQLPHPTTSNLPHTVLPLPTRRVSPLVMRGLIAAIRGQQRLDVDYVSLTNPNREGRVIAPHTFVKTGLRWHLRAWCEKSAQYRDFVLSRFRGQPQLLGKTANTAEHDRAWNTWVELVFAADPRLTPEKRTVVEDDYQMVNGRITLNCRACLAQYLLQAMQVHPKVLDGTPEAQQLVLVNRDDIKQWLFD